MLGAWGAVPLARAAFRARFLPEQAGELVEVAAYELAATLAAGGDDGSAKPPGLIQEVGLDRWRHFVAAAAEKAASAPPAAARGAVVPVQEPLIETVPRLFAKPPEGVVPRYMERIPRQSGKEAADDIPSWARGKPRRAGETPDQFLKRLMDGQYGRDGWQDRPADYSKLMKWGSQAFRDPRRAVPAMNGEEPQA